MCVVKFCVVTSNFTHTFTVWQASYVWSFRSITSSGVTWRGIKGALFEVVYSQSDDAIMLKLCRLLDIGKLSWIVEWRYDDVITWFLMIFSIFTLLTNQLLSEHGIIQIISLFMPLWANCFEYTTNLKLKWEIWNVIDETAMYYFVQCHKVACHSLNVRNFVHKYHAVSLSTHPIACIPYVVAFCTQVI